MSWTTKLAGGMTIATSGLTCWIILIYGPTGLILSINPILCGLAYRVSKNLDARIKQMEGMGVTG